MKFIAVIAVRKIILGFVLLSCAALAAQTARETPPEAPSAGQRKFTVGLAVKASTLGFGLQAAVPVLRRANVRVGFAAFNFDRKVDRDGIDYPGTLALRSVEALFDLFPFSSFHVSPGVLLYNGNNFSADPSVPLGKTFEIGSGSYITDPANPVHGKAKLDFGRVSPMLLVGWGNLIPRNRHFSLSTDFGVAYHGTPRATLTLLGGVCDPSGANCRAITSDPTVQANVQSEVNKMNRDASPYKVFPIVSVAVGYRF